MKSINNLDNHQQEIIRHIQQWLTRSSDGADETQLHRVKSKLYVAIERTGLTIGTLKLKKQLLMRLMLLIHTAADLTGEDRKQLNHLIDTWGQQG